MKSCVEYNDRFSKKPKRNASGGSNRNTPSVDSNDKPQKVSSSSGGGPADAGVGRDDDYLNKQFNEL